MIILENGNEVAVKYGFGSALETLHKGLKAIGNPQLTAIIANDFYSTDEAIRLKQEKGWPLIASIHLSHPDYPQEKKLLDNCDGIIVYSKASKKFLMDNYPDLKVPIEVVQLGIDTDKWQLGTEPREDWLLYVGRSLSGSKGTNELLKKSCVERIPVKFVGDFDSQIEQYKNLAIPNDMFYGYQSQKQLMEFYQKAKMLIMPSTFEPFGLVALEAMACGCPIAVSNVAGVAELLNDEVAYLIDPNNYDLKFDKKFNSENLREFALKLDHINHAKSFVRAVEWLIIKNEVRRGDYSRLNVKDKVVIDRGAYRGETAEYFLEKGAKRVIAFEPNMDNYNDIKDNEFIDKSFVPLREDTVDSILSRGECIKCDCEGAERYILNASPETMAKISEIIIEVHDNIDSDMWWKLSYFLKQNGFNPQVEKHGPNVSMLYANK